MRLVLFISCLWFKLLVVYATLALQTYDPFHSLSSYICLRLQVVPNKSKQEVPASIQETPDPATPTEIVMPIPDPATPTEIVTPIPTPTPPPTPDPSVEEATEACDEEADGTPVTTEPVEDEEPYDGGETDGTPESAVDEQEDIVPQEITQDNVDEQPGLSIINYFLYNLAEGSSAIIM